MPAPRNGGLELRTEGLWADHTIETPFDHLSLGCEAFAIQVDDPAEAIAVVAEEISDLLGQSGEARQGPAEVALTLGQGRHHHGEVAVQLAQGTCPRRKTSEQPVEVHQQRREIVVRIAWEVVHVLAEVLIL